MKLIKNYSSALHGEENKYKQESKCLCHFSLLGTLEGRAAQSMERSSVINLRSDCLSVWNNKERGGGGFCTIKVFIRLSAALTAYDRKGQESEQEAGLKGSRINNGGTSAQPGLCCPPAWGNLLRMTVFLINRWITLSIKQQKIRVCAEFTCIKLRLNKIKIHLSYIYSKHRKANDY